MHTTPYSAILGIPQIFVYWQIMMSKYVKPWINNYLNAILGFFEINDLVFWGFPYMDVLCRKKKYFKSCPPVLTWFCAVITRYMVCFVRIRRTVAEDCIFGNKIFKKSFLYSCYSIELTINVTDEQRHFKTRLSLKTLVLVRVWGLTGGRVGEGVRTYRGSRWSGCEDWQGVALVRNDPGSRWLGLADGLLGRLDEVVRTDRGVVLVRVWGLTGGRVGEDVRTDRGVVLVRMSGLAGGSRWWGRVIYFNSLHTVTIDMHCSLYTKITYT